MVGLKIFSSSTYAKHNGSGLCSLLTRRSRCSCKLRDARSLNRDPAIPRAPNESSRTSSEHVWSGTILRGTLFRTKLTRFDNSTTGKHAEHASWNDNNTLKRICVLYNYVIIVGRRRWRMRLNTATSLKLERLLGSARDNGRE